MKDQLKRISRLLILPIALLLFASCVHRGVEDFYFIAYTGVKQPLFEEPSANPGNEGRLLSVEEGLRTPFYHFKNGLEVGEAERSFFILYTADCPLTLRLQLGDEYLLTELPLFPGRAVEYRHPLPADAVISGFQLETGAAEGELQILSTGLEDLSVGVQGSDELIVIGGGLESGGEARGSIDLYLNEDLLSDSDAARLQVDFRTQTDEQLILRLAGGMDNEMEMTYSPRSGRNRLDIYPAALGFSPRVLRFAGGEVQLESLGVYPPPTANEPLSIDFASLLRFPQSTWRRPEYELFRWNLAPEILVFDFADYATQARFLKRLAFYVEKEGFRGTLVSDEKLAGLHGWNAHDYRAEDLAEFFSLAEESGFPLSEEELLLRRLLIENGILRGRPGGYAFIEGGFISIARESGDYLRELFLTHEGFHGLFFADPGLRQASRDLWSSFDETEKAFWQTFLAWKQYDPADEYLVVNELQAYLLQQTLLKVDPYYLDYTLPRMQVALPSTAPLIEELVSRRPEHFSASALRLDTYLKQRWGVAAGDLENLKYRQ